jgi:hypothetical protein
MDLKFNFLFNYLVLILVLILFLDFSNPFSPHIWKPTLSAFLKSNQFDCWVITSSIFFVCHWCSGTLSYHVRTFFLLPIQWWSKWYFESLLGLTFPEKNKQEWKFLLLMTNILAYSFKISMTMWKGFNIDIALTRP